MIVNFSIPDLINGTFELFGMIFVLLSVKQLYKDKQFKGSHIMTIGYFTAWGCWNIYFYPHLGQSISFVGALGTTLANVTYTCQIIYYKWFYKGTKNA